jgi:hypothetical protein
MRMNFIPQKETSLNKQKKYEFNKWELMEEVKALTEIGIMMVRMEMSYLRWLKGFRSYNWINEYRIMTKHEKITEDMINITLARLEKMPENIMISVGILS